MSLLSRRISQSACLIALLCAEPAQATLSALASWDAVTDPDLASYRVYSGNLPCAAAGPMLKVGEVPKGTTSYTIANIPDGTSVISARVSSVDSNGNESAQSTCAEKVFAPTGPTIEQRVAELEAHINDWKVVLPQIADLNAKMILLEADVAVLKQQRDALKAGWCALKGSSLTKDVLAERAALGGCP